MSRVSFIVTYSKSPAVKLNVDMFIQFVISPLYKCGATLQPCSSVGSQRWGSSPPEGGAAPAWCCPAPRTRCRRRAPAGAPCRSPWHRACRGTEPWPSPCREQRWLRGSVYPASTGTQGRPAGGTPSSNGPSGVRHGDIWKSLPLNEHIKFMTYFLI